MAETPAGTVTFLFTDIEGSTRLLHELGPERYQEVREAQRRILREAAAGAGGREVDTQGDAFFFVFRQAKDALAAAEAAQLRLAEGSELRVRMGIHTGEPIVVDEEYVGMDVHRAARIAAAGHGGQVLLSQATRELLGDDFDVRDLHDHQLKDLTRAERLYQLVIPGLQNDFPPLRSREDAPINLPPQPTRLIGRARELELLGDVLSRSDVRLLTLTGPGGTGKTRLALELASQLAPQFEHGVYFVPLAPVLDAVHVVPTIAQALGLRQAAQQPPLEALVQHLADREMLLLLDNFEQVVAAGPSIAAILDGAPGVKAIVTTREPLHLRSEHEYAVAPLPRTEAVELFMERAGAARSGFDASAVDGAAIETVCERLDGLPLAIELAAARVKVLTPRMLLERLDQRLQVLSAGARDSPERQRTLRATIDWSHDLLDSEEQELFARLGVFVGGFTLDSAEVVAGADLDGVGSLIDKSLLAQQVDSVDVRFVMLETIREYALERLERNGEADAVRARHLDLFVRLATEAEPELVGPDQRVWFARLSAELGNLRAALEWALSTGRADDALRIVAVLWRFWPAYPAEGRRWVDRALAGSVSAPPNVRAKALFSAALLRFFSGEYDDATRFVDEALKVDEMDPDALVRTRSLNILAIIARERFQYTRATALLEEALSQSRSVGWTWGLARTLHSLAQVAKEQGDNERATMLVEESLRLFRELNDVICTLECLLTLGDVTRQLSDDDRTAGLIEECLAQVAQHQGDFANARATFEKSLLLAYELGIRMRVAAALEGLSGSAEATGEIHRAVRLFGAAETLREEIGAPMPSVMRQQFEDRLRSSDLDESEWREAWSEGRAMGLEDAVRYALQRGSGGLRHRPAAQEPRPIHSSPPS